MPPILKGILRCRGFFRPIPQEAAIRLLESDPFRGTDLYETVSLFGYSYSQAGEFNWQLAAHPYVALCMDRKGKSKLRKGNVDHHLEYFGDIKCDVFCFYTFGKNRIKSSLELLDLVAKLSLAIIV